MKELKRTLDDAREPLFTVLLAVLVAFLVAGVVSAQTSKKSRQRAPKGAPTPAATCATGPHPSASLCWGWTQGTGSAATGFYVKRGATPGSETTLATVSGATTLTYMDTAVTEGVTYYYVVTAFNSAGESTPSNEIQAVIPLGIPVAPDSLSGKVN